MCESCVCLQGELPADLRIRGSERCSRLIALGKAGLRRGQWGAKEREEIDRLVMRAKLQSVCDPQT